MAEEKTVEKEADFSEGAIQIGGLKISGLRTYSIVLIIMVSYCIATLFGTKGMDISGLENLALMAAGFIFGAKVLSKR
jgi:hypothetical protein